MKINIIGPSGSGKTFLAKHLSSKLDIKHTNLDYVFFKHVVDKDRIELEEVIWRKNLQRVLKDKNWIIEGVNPVVDIFKNADEIIYIRPTIFSSLYGQWSRYFTDPKQRKEHGFINNLKLTRYLIKQFLEKPNPRKVNDVKYFRIRKIDEILKQFKNKTKILRNRREINNYINKQQVK